MDGFVTASLTCKQCNYQEITQQSVALSGFHENK